MRSTILILVAAASPLIAQQPQATDASLGTKAAKAVWTVPHGFVVRALEQTPDSLLGFRPTAAVRSLGQIFAHVADGEHLFCSLALGQAAPNPFNQVESSKTAKADILAALKASAAHCDQAYAQTDAQGAIAASFFGQPVNRLWLLGMNGAHDYEHYGNIVTYLRLKGITPPSSQR